jgi:hypothetical protein
MSTACAKLASAPDTAQVGPPIPDAALQRLHAEALAGLAPGSADCKPTVSGRAGDGRADVPETAADPGRVSRPLAEPP